MNITNRAALITIYLGTFFFSLFDALPVYVDSSFLKTFLSDSTIGIVYAVTAIFSIAFVLNTPHFLRTMGGRRLIIILAVAEAIAFFGLAAAHSVWAVVPLFVLYHAVFSMLFISMDTILENFSTDEATGAIRGIFLTILNIALLVAPFFAGLLLTDGDFWKVYLAAGFTAIPLIILIGTRLRKWKDPEYHDTHIISTFREIYRNKNLRAVTGAYALLYFFYVWMIIYLPLFLHDSFGIPYHEIVGIIIPISLIPFVFLQLIAGRIADTELGEKELMVVGFVIMALSTAALAFITTANIWIWAGVLFVTRIGASIVEIMTETYFFKQINGAQTNIISGYRMVIQIAFLVGPALASLLLWTFHLEFKYLFLILAGFLLVFGLKWSLELTDTR